MTDTFSSSTPFTATTANEPTYDGLLQAICQNPFIKWLASQNRFVLLALIVIFILLIIAFKYYVFNLNLYTNEFQFVFKGEKDLRVKEIIPGTTINVSHNDKYQQSTVFWLYVDPPSEDQDMRQNRIIYMRGETIAPSVVFYVDQRFNTLKCSLRIRNQKDIEYQQDHIGLYEQLKFDHDPLCSQYLTLKYPQIPVQRWVQVALVQSQYTAELWLDNYLVDTGNTANVKFGCADEDTKLEEDPKMGRFPIVQQSGDIKINPNSEKVSPQHGYIKGLQMFNTAITQEKIKNIYRTNPDTPSELKYQFNQIFNFN